MKENTYTTTHQKKKMSIDTHTIMYQANFPAVDIESVMYPANFAGGRSRLDLLLPSFLPSREEKKKQERRNHSSGSRGILHTPHTDRVRIETKMQERIFYPIWGHVVGRMQYAPTSCRQERLFPINSRKERTETKMQRQKNRPLGSRGVWHMPFMRQGERDAVWRDTFLEQRAHVAVWQDRHLEEKSSHARFQMRISGENSNPYKSSLVALSEQLRDIFST